jgi:hypothetical protein
MRLDMAAADVSHTHTHTSYAPMIQESQENGVNPMTDSDDDYGNSGSTSGHMLPVSLYCNGLSGKTIKR